MRHRRASHPVELLCESPLDLIGGASTLGMQRWPAQKAGAGFQIILQAGGGSGQRASGQAEVVIVGGVESMSRVPLGGSLAGGQPFTPATF
jgi:acetyl-CoA acetyltransferase